METGKQQRWFWSNTFNHWQKRNNRIYVYVTPVYGSFKAQLYITGTTSMCELEAQTNGETKEELLRLFSLAEEWLETYKSGNLEDIHKDVFSISNPKGFWVKDHEEKRWRI